LIEFEPLKSSPWIFKLFDTLLNDIRELVYKHFYITLEKYKGLTMLLVLLGAWVLGAVARRVLNLGFCNITLAGILQSTF